MEVNRDSRRSRTNDITLIINLMIILLLKILLSNVLPSFVNAQEPVDASQAAANSPAEDELDISEEDAIQNILSMMRDQTEIATRTRMNADFVPGMITLLHGDELESSGIRTVFEALSLVPGMTISINAQGKKTVMVRGFGVTSRSGDLKLMLNKIPLNMVLTGNAEALFNIPVEQIDRIEIIRGPGSVLYGGYAYAGVINVVTRKSGNRVFGRYGSYGTYAGGGLISYDRPETNLSFSLNLSYWDTDGADVTCDADRLYGTSRQYASHAPGPTDEAYDNFSGIMTFNYRSFSLLGQLNSTRSGDYFGYGNTLSDDDDDDDKEQEFVNPMVEAIQSFEFSQDFRGELKFGWIQSSVDQIAELLPSGYGIRFPDGLVEKSYYTERTLYGGPEFFWQGWKRHNLLAGFSITDTEVLNASQEENGEEKEWAVENENRRCISVYLQDEIDVSDYLVITPGLRYDNYDDVGESFTPRIAAVYRISDRHILKAQYAEAFNPPALIEIEGSGLQFSGNEDIDPETIQTYELGYIFKDVRSEGRITFFYSYLEDLIYIEALDEERRYRFANIGEADLKGAELDVQHQLSEKYKIGGNIAYVTTEDKETGEEIEGAANWLANLSLLYKPSKNYSINALYQYVGKRHRAEGDSRSSLDEYNTVGVTFSAFNLGVRGLSCRFGINNMFDEEVVFPAPPNSYPDDFPRGGREWWVQLSYEF